MFTSTPAIRFTNRLLSFWELSVILFLVLGCASANFRQSKPISSIDTRYRLERWKNRAFPATESQGIAFYRRIFSHTLGSHCTFFPSDSESAQLVFRTCGPLKGIGRAMSRFYEEPDAPFLGLPIVKIENRLLFTDIRPDCAWF